MKPIEDILSASASQWLRGLVAAAATGAGTALAGVVAGMTPHSVLTMVAIQAIVHVGLYLQHPALPAPEGSK